MSRKIERDTHIQPQFVHIGDLIINLANITYITKRKITENGKEDTRISILLIGEQQPIEFWASKPGGQALLEWWEKVVPELTTITTIVV